jgi:hypothetical protein
MQSLSLMKVQASWARNIERQCAAILGERAAYPWHALGKISRAPPPAQPQLVKGSLDLLEVGLPARSVFGRLHPLVGAPAAWTSRVCRRNDRSMTTRRFPAPWRADKMPGGYVVRARPPGRPLVRFQRR